MIFVFDWDGTLGGHESVMTPSSERVLKYLHDKNHDIIIATGRNPKDVISRLGSTVKYVSRYVIGSNGGAILDRETNKPVFEAQLSEVATRKTVEYAREHDLIFGIVEHGDTIFYRATENAPTHVISDLYPPVKNIFKDEDFQKHNDKIALIGMTFPNNIEEHFKALEKRIPEAHIVFADRIWIQTVPFGVSKFDGIKKVLKLIGKENEQIIAFGDSGNDKPMLEGAHIGIAMGDAKDDVKAAANVVIDTAENQGIEKYVMENY